MRECGDECNSKWGYWGIILIYNQSPQFTSLLVKDAVWKSSLYKETDLSEISALNWASAVVSPVSHLHVLAPEPLENDTLTLYLGNITI